MATDLDTERGIVRVPTGTWTVDPAHSSVEFRVKHMMISTVRGRFGEFEGTIEAAADYHQSRVRGMVKTASIDTNEPRRDDISALRTSSTSSIIRRSVSVDRDQGTIEKGTTGRGTSDARRDAPGSFEAAVHGVSGTLKGRIASVFSCAAASAAASSGALADPAHTLYMSLYKEARRADGLAIRYQGADGKTLFKLNPKRRELGAKKAGEGAGEGRRQVPRQEGCSAQAGTSSRRPRARSSGTPGSSRRSRRASPRLPERDPLHRSARGRLARRRRGLDLRRRRRRDGRRGGGARHRSRGGPSGPAARSDRCSPRSGRNKKCIASASVGKDTPSIG